MNPNKVRMKKGSRHLRRPPGGPACWPASPGCHRTERSWSGFLWLETLREGVTGLEQKDPVLNGQAVLRVQGHGRTEKLVEEVDDLLPGLGRLLACKLREVGSGVVDVEAVDALQHDGDHSLKTTEPRSGEQITELILTGEKTQEMLFPALKTACVMCNGGENDHFRMSVSDVLGKKRFRNVESASLSFQFLLSVQNGDSLN